MTKLCRYLMGLLRISLAILVVLNTLLLAACSTATQTTGSGTTGGNGTSAVETSTLPAARPQDVFEAFGRAWAGLDYAAMYQMLSAEVKTRITADTFSERYKKIMNGIEAKNIRIIAAAEGIQLPADGKSAVMAFSVSMDTLAGSINTVGYHMNLLPEIVNNQTIWTVNWSEKLIFPHMEPTDRVLARILSADRGEIRDRNSQGLAINGQLITIGVVPGKFNTVKAEAIPQIAQLLGISEKRINTALANATNPTWFYPIVTIPASAKDLSAQLTAIDGVQYQKTNGRIYPAGVAAGLMIGYLGAITAEELARHPGEGYTAADKIGKMGLEQVYEKRLKGQSGAEIYLTTADSVQVKEQLALKEPVDGENITLAIDSKVQDNLYNQMNGDAGAAAAINPQTGEILALVSTPSFDPNLLQTYVPDEVQAAWNSAVKSPFANRFKICYAPGSVFKLVTASIGLKMGVLNPDEALPISGFQWQPDTSWGNYKVTRVKDPGKPINLLSAFLYSDNIYFAQQALRIGKDGFSQGAAGFGIGESLPIDYPFSSSQIANSGLKNTVLLADTGYGQGEVLVSPLHIAMFYSALATNGDLMKPVLELKGALQPQIWKPQAIASANVPLLTQALVQVVENPAGSGYTKQAARTRMLGKTGTAELKTSLQDTQAEENGWFVAMNIDQPRLTIAMMIEDVKTRGASHYVVPLVKRAMDELMLLNPGG